MLHVRTTNPASVLDCYEFSVNCVKKVDLEFWGSHALCLWTAQHSTVDLWTSKFNLAKSLENHTKMSRFGAKIQISLEKLALLAVLAMM